MIHNGEKPFKCSHSDFKCSRSSHLKNHKRVHTGDKSFSCSKCDYKSSRSSHLKTHERIHIGVKPFSCFYCDYKCSRATHLKLHERIHTDKKPFCCSHCDFKCSDSSSLKRHQSVHVNDKTFLRKIKEEIDQIFLWLNRNLQCGGQYLLLDLMAGLIENIQFWFPIVNQISPHQWLVMKYHLTVTDPSPFVFDKCWVLFFQIRLKVWSIWCIATSQFGQQFYSMSKTEWDFLQLQL